MTTDDRNHEQDDQQRPHDDQHSLRSQWAKRSQQGSEVVGSVVALGLSHARFALTVFGKVPLLMLESAQRAAEEDGIMPRQSRRQRADLPSVRPDDYSDYSERQRWRSSELSPQRFDRQEHPDDLEWPQQPDDQDTQDERYDQNNQYHEYDPDDQDTRPDPPRRSERLDYLAERRSGTRLKGTPENLRDAFRLREKSRGSRHSDSSTGTAIRGAASELMGMVAKLHRDYALVVSDFSDAVCDALTDQRDQRGLRGEGRAEEPQDQSWDERGRSYQTRRYSTQHPSAHTAEGSKVEKVDVVNPGNATDATDATDAADAADVADVHDEHDGEQRTAWELNAQWTEPSLRVSDIRRSSKVEPVRLRRSDRPSQPEDSQAGRNNDD